MEYDHKVHHRQSIRLKHYDYSQAGMYFVSICVHNRKCLFGNISNGVMTYDDVGKMIENEWLKIPQRFKNIELHKYIVMPNHFHAILAISTGSIVTAKKNVGKSIGNVVGAFKSITTNEYIRMEKTHGWQRFNGKLWQRNYWEHILRSEDEYQRISEYIINNPLKWDLDKLNNASLINLISK